MCPLFATTTDYVLESDYQPQHELLDWLNIKKLFSPRARATSKWFDDLKEIMTDGSSLSLLSVYDTYSNLRAA